MVSSAPTIPHRDARAIAGLSMGGYGALAIAARHPERFASVYAVSPGLFGPNGLARSQIFRSRPDFVDDILADSGGGRKLPATLTAGAPNG